MKKVVTWVVVTLLVVILFVVLITLRTIPSLRIYLDLVPLGAAAAAAILLLFALSVNK